jgi:CRP-like cAMP-binding protein
VAAAQSMEEIFYVKGDDIIQQDDIGESFFVLEEGEVTVTVSRNPDTLNP